MVALKVDLSSMTISLASAVIRARFQKAFNDNNAIIAAITVRSLSASGQSKKDLYKQMFIQEMRSHAAGNEVTVGQEKQAEKKKMTFMTFSRMTNQMHRVMSKLK